MNDLIDRFRNIAIGLCLLALVGGGAFYVMVGAGLVEIGGDDDGSFPRIVFSALEHEAGNDRAALFCDQSACPLAVADKRALVSTETPRELRNRLVAYVDASPRVRPRDQDFANNHYSFVEPMGKDGFPALIAIEIQPRPLGGSQILLFSTKPVGASTLSEHLERLERWSAILVTK